MFAGDYRLCFMIFLYPSFTVLSRFEAGFLERGHVVLYEQKKYIFYHVSHLASHWAPFSLFSFMILS